MYDKTRGQADQKRFKMYGYMKELLYVEPEKRRKLGDRKRHGQDKNGQVNLNMLDVPRNERTDHTADRERQKDLNGQDDKGSRIE